MGGETIQISLGPAANAVTSHLCNLQGLAATTTSDSLGNDGIGNENGEGSPLCDPYVTHAVHKETYVPRVLFVDGKNCYEPWPDNAATTNYDTNIQSNRNLGTGTSVADNHHTHTMSLDAWRGNVEVHNYNSMLSASAYKNDGEVASHSQSMNSNLYHEAPRASFADTFQGRWNQVGTDQKDAFRQYQQDASMLYSTSSTNVNSRFHSSRYSKVSSQYIHSQSSVLHSDAGGRCMVWDDDDEEEEEEELDEYSRQRRLDQERQRWNRKEHETLDHMTHAWDTFMGVDVTTSSSETASVSRSMPSVSKQNDDAQDPSLSTPEDDGTANEKEKKGINVHVLQALQWMNYFMPPHPANNMYAAPLPFDRQLLANNATMDADIEQKRQRQTLLYSFYSGEHPTSSSSSFCGNMGDGMSTDWRENILSDKIRRWMEDCDSVRAFQVMVDDDMNFFGGLATSVLQELSDECKSAAKVSIMIRDGDSFSTIPSIVTDENGTSREAEEDGKYWRSENKVVQAFRSDLNAGLALHGIAENSDLALPLSLSKCWESLHQSNRGSSGGCDPKRNLFQASAVGALALEAVTLPCRVAGGARKNQYKIGLNSGFFQGAGQSDGQDAYPTAERLTYHEFVSSLKPSNRHNMTELSGYQQPKLSPLEMHNRLLQGTSIERRQLEEERNRNRNSYYRRSRGRDVEPGLWADDEAAGGIMYSLSPMGRAQSSHRSFHEHFALAASYRPLQSRVGDVVSTYNTALMEGMGVRYRPQTSIATVAAHPFESLTGSRGSYWGAILNNHSRKNPAQVLALLGNSTRIHSHLKSTAIGLKNALSRKYTGYLTRDNMSGLAPESEDCDDALEGCLSLRDLYEHSMEYDDEDEGVYFEDNCD